MIELRIPTPPTSNSMWRSVGGRNILSKAAREWKAGAHRAIRSQLPAGYVRLRGPVLLRALIQVPTLASDVSNRIKLLEDALTEAGVWDDDKQVGEIRARKVIASGGTCEARVWVEPMDHPELAERLAEAAKRALKPRKPRPRKLKGGALASPNVRRARP